MGIVHSGVFSPRNGLTGNSLVEIVGRSEGDQLQAAKDALTIALEERKTLGHQRHHDTKVPSEYSGKWII